MKNPELRFKNDIDDWEEREIKNICKSQKTGILTKDKVSNNFAMYPVVNGGIDFYGFYDKYNNENAITISSRGENAGYARYVSGKFWAGGLCYAYTTPKDNVEFVGLVLNAKEFDIKNNMIVRTTIPALNKNSFDYYSIKIPNPTIQSQIATLLSNIDTKIESQEQKVEKLKIFKSAMLDKMFPKERQKVPEIRFDGFSGDWEEKEFKTIGSFLKGNGYSKNDLISNGTPIFLYGRLYTKYKTITKEIDTFVTPKPNSIYSIGNEVVIPASGETVEDIAIASHIVTSGVILGSDLNIIRPFDCINSVFLALLISNTYIKEELSKKAQGKSIVHIHNYDIEELKGYFPTIEEQEKIGKYFEELDNKIELEISKVNKLKNVRDAMLNKLLS